ncbi:hypothetical protein Tco_1053615 [Tanacetum coccineum]|uniref:Reverse transcriptase domain-containing protein n=1 Tax=Tanacetum coccineum TaxID=301880 RepID=A0ABQ5GUD6_9ASTR
MLEDFKRNVQGNVKRNVQFLLKQNMFLKPSKMCNFLKPSEMCRFQAKYAGLWDRTTTTFWWNSHTITVITRALKLAPIEHLTIRDHMQAARDRQKSYADKRRRPLEFEVGDKVMLKGRAVGVVDEDLKGVNASGSVKVETLLIDPSELKDGLVQ